MTRIAALLRVSTQRQAKKHRDDEETLPMQREAIRRFVASRPDWNLVHEFAEEGVSAWSNSSEDRRVLQEVLAEAKRGLFDVLVIFKYDRLSRVSLEYPTLLSFLYRLGVAVWSVADDGTGRELTIETQMDKLLRFVEGWQAEMESVNTSVRVSAKMRQMAQKGIWTGGRPPYGFRLMDGGRQKNGGQSSLEIDASEAAVVREIFRMYLGEERGTTTIARKLNELGYRLRNGKEWRDTTVRDIIKNPTVAGRPAYGRHYRDKATGNWRHRPPDSPEIIIAPDTIAEWEIIPWDTWRQAQARMARWNPHRHDGVEDRTRRSRAESGALLLTGILRCGYCGGPLTAGWAMPVKTLKDGTKVRYRYPRYIDRNRYGGQRCAGQLGYSVTRLDSAVLAAAREVLQGMDSNELYQELRRQISQGAFQHTERLGLGRRREAQAERLLSEWTARLNKYLLRPEDSWYPEEFLAEQIQSARAALKAAQDDRQRLERQGCEVEQRLANLTEFQSVAPDFWQRFLVSDPAKQKRLLRQLFEQVIVYRDGIELRWRLDLAEILGNPQLAPLQWQAQTPWPDGSRRDGTSAS
ncbi:MAG: recombinase family protein [Thermaerobacter sp.]|nr:recombinase family protein [Thermaerobacter sp.]